MRLWPSYKHSSGARVQLIPVRTYVERNWFEGGWFFICTTANGETLNSLWRAGEGSLFETAVDAMIAAESAMATKEVIGG